MDTPTSLLPGVVRTASARRAWLSSDHCAGPVLDVLGALGWSLVSTPEANVHSTSPDGLVYVGWLPEDADARKRGIVWQIQVASAGAEPWVQEFGIDSPAEAVAGFIGALVANSSR